MKFAQRIRQARHKAKLSQQALAKIVGVQRSAVSNWESASRVTPSIVNLVAIAKATEVSVEWLGTGRGSMRLGHDSQLDVPAVDLDLVDDPQERELLRLFRVLSHRSRTLIVELAAELAARQTSTTRRKRNPH